MEEEVKRMENGLKETVEKAKAQTILPIPKKQLQKQEQLTLFEL